jgi:glyceraldehyde-3-phosphate dehydrogenase (NAD(P))
VIRVAINGFGRIGRNFARCWVGRENSNIELVAINDTSDPKTNAHLLRYDTMLGKLRGAEISADDNSIIINGKTVKCVSDRNPENLPWKEWGIDLIIEATGVFTAKDGAMKHVNAGAKKVLITAPGKNEDGTFVMGVNHHDYDHNKHHIISASCTTNCLAPIAKVLNEKFGIIKGTMTTTHSYTGDQRLLDASHRDLRRARAAAMNIVPTSTGAAKAVALVLPDLKGKLNGVALRVPTPNVSMVDFVVQVEKRTITEEVNEALKHASENDLKGILGYSDLPLVSSDYQGTDESSIVDANLTLVMGSDMVKVMAWYDNEWGYSQRVLDLAELVAAKWQ